LGREAGVRVKVVKANREGFIDPPKVTGALSSRTKVVAITHVSNVLGTVQRLEEIGRLVKERKAVFVVDGAQSVGRIPVDVAKINCDFYAGCGRKALMGPQGTGFLFGKRDMLEGLRPLVLGSRAADVVSSSEYQLKPVPLRFEAGIINTSGFIGLGAAAEYFQTVGLHKIQTRLQKLTSLLVEGLEGIEGVKIYGGHSVQGQAGIVSWNLDTNESHEVAKSLGEMGILMASGAQGSPLAMKTLGIRGVVRTSVHYYNTEKELGRFLDCLKSMRCKGGSNDSRG
jgi:cysteine desulfurase/selenocysteine lyase